VTAARGTSRVSRSMESRPGARCRGCSRSGSPGRSPNRTCGFHRIRLSTDSVVGRSSGAVPRVGDLVAAVAVPDDGYRGRVEQLDPSRADESPRPGWGW
jgi:hypothetical protein